MTSSAGPSIPTDDLSFVTVPQVTVSSLTKSGGKVKVQVNNHDIALIMHRGQVHAIQSRCPHQGGPLEQGQIEEAGRSGACIRCPLHHYEFNLVTGVCAVPQNFSKKMMVFPVQIDKDEIKVGFRK